MARGSPNMAAVSLVVPAIHPYIGSGCYPATNHGPELVRGARI